MADPWLDTMEQRLDILEQQVFGSADKEQYYPKDAPQVIDTMANLNAQINSTIAGRKKVEAVMTKLPVLTELLDPAFADKLTLSEEAKTEVVLMEESLIRQQAANLEKVEQMLNLLNSEHIKENSFKVVPSLQGRLQQAGQTHVNQQDQANQLTQETKDVLLHYNNVITTLSKQFVHWDETITKLEAAKQTKKLQD